MNATYTPVVKPTRRELLIDRFEHLGTTHAIIAFANRSNRERESPAETEAKTSPGGTVATVCNGHRGAQPRESLVIEDYYSVSVEPPDAQTTPASLLAEALDADSLKIADDIDITPSGQGSSFISEGEGPAQWLAAPQVGLVHGNNLAMESAEDTSESEGELRQVGGLIKYISHIFVGVSTVFRCPSRPCYFWFLYFNMLRPDW